MANKPELSIKVSVDPILDREKLENDVQAQVSNIKNLPPVPIEPDTSGFKRAIEENIGEPYPVEITPTFTKNLTQQVNDEITAAQNGAQQLKVKLDVKEFGNDLSKQLKEQLRGVNRTLSNYLKEMQTNLALANKATYGLFGGGNRDVTIDSIFNEISKKDIKKAQTLNRQLNDIYSEMPKLKETGKISADSDITSIDQMSKALIDLSNSLSLMSKAWDEADESVYNSTYKDFEKTYDSIKNAIVQLEELYNAPGALKNLNIKGSILKNFIDNAKGGIEDISNLRGQGGDYSVFSKSVEDYHELLDYASTFTHLNDLIGQSISRSQKEIDGLKKSEQEFMGAGIPIDPSILDANTKKIIQSIGEVSAAMGDLEKKSKNFSTNLTIEVDKHVGNIEEKVKQLKALVDVLPNGQKNIPEDSKGSVDSKGDATGAEGGLSSVSIQGKVVITDADVSVDIKNPVKIPSVAIVDSENVQFQASSNLKENTDAIASAKKSLQGIVGKTENYATDISALGPAFQYVAQEVDNLSHSLENQILDFNRILEQTNTYIDKTDSISIDTSNVAVTGEPASITGKVVLGDGDVVPPEAPVDIKGHVTLEPTDITPPSESIELQGKITKTTMESAAKGKRKKGQDIEKPEVVELNGHVKLEDKDIERPDPVVMNDKVTVTKDNIKLPEGGIDVKGNLILKNAEIANAIKENSKTNSDKKKNTKSNGSNNSDDVKAQQEANRLLLQEEQTQQRIADAAQRKAEAEDKAFNRETASLQKKYDQAELDNLNRIEKKYKELTVLEKQRGTFTKPEKALNLLHTEAMIDKAKKELDLMLQNASETGYNPLKVSSIGDQAMKYFFAKTSSDNKFDSAAEAIEQRKLKEEHDQYIKDLRLEVSLEKDLRDGRNKYGSNGTYVKQTSADLKALKRKNRGYEYSVGYDFLSQDEDWISLTSQKRNQRLQYQDAALLKKEKQKNFFDKYNEYSNQKNASLSVADPDVLKIYEKQLEEKAEEISNDYEKLVEILSPEELDAFLEKLRGKVRSSEQKMEITEANLKAKNNNETSKQVSTLSKSINDAKSSYGLNKDDLDADSLSDTQKAILAADEAISKIKTLTAGTDEYATAIENANQKWREAELLIEKDQKAQNALISSVKSIQKQFALLEQEVSPSLNNELKKDIEGIITRARDLNAKDPHTYENYANDLLQLRQDSYAVQAKHTLWRKGYKGLEKKGNQIAQGVEVARQMHADGSLHDIDFKNIDELIAKLNKLPAQTDEYAKTLEEISPLWEEIKKKVDAVNESEKQVTKQANAKISGKRSVNDALNQNGDLMGKVKRNNGVDKYFYSQLSEKQKKLESLLREVDSSTDPVQAAKKWAGTNLKTESPENINSVTAAVKALNNEYNEATTSARDFNATVSQEKSYNKASTEVANLKSMIHDYLEANKKLQSMDTGKGFYELLEELNHTDAPEKISELKKRYAELRAESKKLGLESESLLDKFEKLFGQHLSTMITMAALHQMQNALRVVYQNVVDIDTAVTELRKVSEYAGKSLEEYMNRAATQAQKLGVSISDYINSTADWKRLGYSDEDAENLATYSTLLRNVGDGIDDVSTSSSYLISTLQGFGLLADQAEDVVNKIDAVANTQPVTANDLGEILTRSSAAMSAANNTLEETIALGTAANAVIQDADTVGTTLKSLSMYLRAAKTDAENAGIEVDGMANSVSELRSELKSLTGVDVMLDSKNFKSTYQIMKELSQVWSNLSDVTQANVTELIGGKRNANAVSAILNNFSVAESAMESAANSANVAWEENEKYLDSIQGRLAQLDASFQALSTDVLSSDLVKTGVSFLTTVVKLIDKLVNLTGALPLGLGITSFIGQLGEPKMTGFMIVPSNTPGGDTEQVFRMDSIISVRSMREYLEKPTNMVA